MPAGPSADGLRRGFRVRAIQHGACFRASERLLLLSLNALPLLHILGAAALFAFAPGSREVRGAAVVVGIFFVPPLLARFVVGSGLPTGQFDVPSRPFFRWWAVWSLQATFNRLPWIEETFRLVPGLYSAWLRLWGARVGRMTLWSPGTRVFDRPLVVIGDDVVIGLDARLIGHFSGLDSRGRASLTVGPVTLGDRTIIGASALLGAGFVLESDQATEALFLGFPFTRWRAGDRVPPEEEFLQPSKHQ
jgi:hypothetical protein